MWNFSHLEKIFFCVFVPWEQVKFSAQKKNAKSQIFSSEKTLKFSALKMQKFKFLSPKNGQNHIFKPEKWSKSHFLDTKNLQTCASSPNLKDRSQLPPITLSKGEYNNNKKLFSFVPFSMIINLLSKIQFMTQIE